MAAWHGMSNGMAWHSKNESQKFQKFSEFQKFRFQDIPIKLNE
jgi:hypothetical protein